MVAVIRNTKFTMLSARIICLLIFGCIIVSIEGGFAPSAREEMETSNCLLNGRTRGKICHRLLKVFKVARVKRNLVGNERNEFSSAASEYICALNDYQNTAKRGNDVSNATLNMGSCNRIFPSMRKTWKGFFANRDCEIRVQKPVTLTKNGSQFSTWFNASDLADRFDVSNFKAVDLIIARSVTEDIETFGKYTLIVTYQMYQDNGIYGDRIIVHKSIQATCPSSGKRYFVAGLNEQGLQALSSSINGGGLAEFIVKIIPQKQIVQVHTGSYEEQEFDVGVKVTELVLHTPSTKNVVPLRSRNINRDVFRTGGRQKRDIGSSLQREGCRRKPYIMDYRNNKNVIRPFEIDIGECEGSCENVFLLDLNSTNHALSMHSEKQLEEKDPRNPQPTVCCAPISFSRFHFITVDERGSLMSAYTDNMVTEYCGCI